MPADIRRRPCAVTDFAIIGSDVYAIRRFFAGVCGWTSVESSGADGMMITSTKGPMTFVIVKIPKEVSGLVGGLIPIIAVEDLSDATAQATDLGGAVLFRPDDETALIQDPAGGKLLLREKPILRPELVSRVGTPPVVRIPAMTKRLLDHIVHIANSYQNFDLDEESRRLWELDQNVSCLTEFDAVGPILQSLTRPERILELGPGCGRSAIFFAKQLGWKASAIDLFE